MSEVRSQEGALSERSSLATIGLVAGVLGTTALIFGLILYAIDPATAYITTINLVFAAGALVFYGLTHRRQIGRTLGGRSTPLILLEIVWVSALLAAGVAVNYFAAQSTRTFDVTESSRFTLAEQSARAAQGLKGKVQVIGFYKGQEPARGQLERLIELYRGHTDQLELEFKNPDKITPAVAAQYKMSASSPKIVLVTADGRQLKLKAPTEQALTSALIQLTERPEQKAYFLTGHGEPPLNDDKDENGYSRAAQELVDEGFKVESLSLVEQNAVPRDAALVLLVAPKSALFPNEVKALEAFLDEGGFFYVLLDPGQATGLDALFERFGIKVGDDLVVDSNPAGQAMGFGVDAPVIQKYEAHPITAPLKGKALLLYWARSVLPSPSASDAEPSTLFSASASSWGESRWREGGDVSLDEADLPGPVPLAVASVRNTHAAPHKRSDEARLAVFGDASFANNRFFTMSAAHGDLFLNTVSWLTGNTAQITIRPRDPSADRIVLTPSQQSQIIFFSVNLLPLIILGIGFSVWAVRRRQ